MFVFIAAIPQIIDDEYTDRGSVRNASRAHFSFDSLGKEILNLMQRGKLFNYQVREIGFPSQHLYPAHGVEQLGIAEVLVTFAASPQDRNLLVLDTRRFGEVIDYQITKVLAQDSGTRLQLRLRDHEDEHATRFQPCVGVLQKDQFQALVIRLCHLQVVGRIEIEKRDRFGWTAHIHRVRLQCFDTQISGLFGTIGINFNAVSVGLSSLQQTGECHAIASTRINCRELRSGT
jgi:hypothetical protein